MASKLGACAHFLPDESRSLARPRDVDGDPPSPELRNLDSVASVRAFFQVSLTRANLATAAGYPVSGSGSEATVETVRAALNI